jgi:hypothetical protein
MLCWFREVADEANHPTAGPGAVSGCCYEYGAVPDRGIREIAVSFRRLPESPVTTASAEW